MTEAKVEVVLNTGHFTRKYEVEGSRIRFYADRDITVGFARREIVPLGCGVSIPTNRHYTITSPLDVYDNKLIEGENKSIFFSVIGDGKTMVKRGELIATLILWKEDSEASVKVEKEE